MTLLNIDRDNAKQIPIAIMNGGKGYADDLNGKKVCITDVQTPDWLIGIANENTKAYDHFISTPQGKKTLTRISKKHDFNIQGKVWNDMICIQENKLLCFLYKYLQTIGINCSTFIFDGLHLPIDLNGKNLNQLIPELENEMLKLKIPMKLSVKKFEDIDLSGLKKQDDMDTTDEGLAKIVMNTFKYKYHQSKDAFYIYNDVQCLWIEYTKDAILWKQTEMLSQYITDRMIPDTDELTDALTQIKSASKITNVVKFMFKKIKAEDHSTFIDEFFNVKKGVLPITYKIRKGDVYIDKHKIVDFKTGKLRNRTETDYFTFTTHNKVLPKPNVEFVKDYLKEILTTNNDEYISYFIRTIGYILSGENNLKRFYILIGKKDTGKSLFLKLLIKILDLFGGMANDKVFKMKSASCHDTEAFSIQNKRLACVSELAENEKFNEILIKAISGGDSLNLRRAGSKVNEPVLFNTVLMLATNEVPTFHEKAFAGRIRVFDFKTIFENNDERATDILNHSNDFFTVFVQGAKDYYENNKKIVDVEEVILASKALVESKNPVSVFWNEQSSFEFVKDEKSRVKKIDVFELFAALYPKVLGKQKFYEMFEDIFKKELLSTHYAHNTQWGGLGIKMNNENPNNRDDTEISIDDVQRFVLDVDE
jgi:P4 family phage/plasmid primase-like protien